MTKRPPEGSRGWYRREAKNNAFIVRVVRQRLAEVLADYDAVETELRQRIKTCTCGKGTTP